MTTYQRNSKPEMNNNDMVKYENVMINKQSIDTFEVKRFSTFGWIKFALGLIFLFPIRVVITVASTLIIVLLYIINLPFIRPADQPQFTFIRWERSFVSRVWSRFVLFINGFFWIHERGKPNPRARLIIGNHSSCLDMFFFLYRYSPSFVVAEFVDKNFFLGPLSHVFNCLPVDRSTSGNSSNFLIKLKERLSSEENTKIYGVCMIFPEGATSNGNTLNYFHSGAFIPGEPLQPVVVQYTDSINPTQWSVRSWAFHFLVMMCNLTNSLYVTYLPIYYPSQAERENPRLFAQNVKNSMSCAINKTKLSSSSSSSNLNYSSVSFPSTSSTSSSAPLYSATPNFQKIGKLFFPQTLLTYKDRKDYETIRNMLIKNDIIPPQPRSQSDISISDYYLCSSILAKDNESESSTLSNNSSSLSTPLLSSKEDSTVTTIDSPLLSSSTSNDLEKGKGNSTISERDLTLIKHSGLLFMMDVPPESYDYNLSEYHSHQQLPPPQLLSLIQYGFSRSS